MSNKKGFFNYPLSTLIALITELINNMNKITANFNTKTILLKNYSNLSE